MNGPLRAMARAAAGLFLLTLPLGGCVNTYMDQKADLRAGGPQSREAAAQYRHETAKARNADLNDQLVSTQRDIDRYERRIASAQNELRTVRSDLDRARRNKKLSDSEYNRMKAEYDDINREINDLDFKVKAGGLSDNSAKEKSIVELERKKSELEKVIQFSLNR